MKNLFAAVLMTVIAACATNDAAPVSPGTEDIACTTDHDCASAVGGGRCDPASHACRATNACETNADCASSQVCARSSAFGGLCVTLGTPPTPEPAPSCIDVACPPFEVCSDGVCHERACVTDAQCPAGDTCHHLCPTDATTDSSAGSVLGGVCQPGWIESEVCPVQDPPPPGSGADGSPSSSGAP